jgi:bifunctional non-homologous end joining protein LigD
MPVNAGKAPGKRDMARCAVPAGYRRGVPGAPMLATAGPLPDGPGWSYEFKWDGVRALATVRHGRLRLNARSGADVTLAYPELEPLGGLLDDAVLDGEIVAMDHAGRPSFTTLAERMHVREPVRAARLAATTPVTYLIFDLLRLDGADVTGQPYRRRRAALEELGLAGERWLVPPRFDDWAATLAASQENGLEGVVAKRLDSPYRPGARTADWVKYKLEETEEFVVGGWRPGARTIGALLVGLPTTGGRLDFVGRVGGGISAASERALLAVLRPRVVPSSPFSAVLAREDSKDAQWVRPEIVVEVKYGQRTPDGRLRFPRFLRLRPDLDVAEWTGG